MEAARIGINGIGITEHDRIWSKDDVLQLSRKCNIKLFPGIEITTDKGHIIAFGFNNYISGMYRTDQLRKLADTHGAVLIWAHPYRRVLDSCGLNDELRLVNGNTKDIAGMLRIVDVLEVANGNCSDEENIRAFTIARDKGINGTGGSDAHSKHGLGYYATLFEKDVSTVEELVNELKNGNFYPVHINSSREVIACWDLWDATDIHNPRP